MGLELVALALAGGQLGSHREALSLQLKDPLLHRRLDTEGAG